ncbi:MAG: hypothetical protein K9H64_17220 [Bacteroidales bacterium]|nr:hypothetical protein [Bacteroidales bacterium]MCF8457701.1 hypothetical protein [Bacteroidales bacterium]
MKRPYFYFFFGLIFTMLFIACEDTEKGPSPNENAELLSFSTCKTMKSYYATDSVQDNQSCIEFSFADSILLLTHVNAGFNCCPGNITADFVFDGNTITISEHEAAADCDCDCLYDLTMQMAGIAAGTYHFVFVEPYAGVTGQGIDFTLNLHDSVVGNYCVTRNFYPWGYGGKVLNVSDCKNMKSSLTAANQSCIEYLFADGLLQIDHLNAGFNCCPGDITADFIVNGNTITIYEHETVAECNCNCLYDIEMQIGNLQLGTYHLIFEEPYASQAGQEIELTINLNDSLSGSYCVQREFYPWGIFK